GGIGVGLGEDADAAPEADVVGAEAGEWGEGFPAGVGDGSLGAVGGDLAAGQVAVGEGADAVFFFDGFGGGGEEGGAGVFEDGRGAGGGLGALESEGVAVVGAVGGVGVDDDRRVPPVEEADQGAG